MAVENTKKRSNGISVIKQPIKKQKIGLRFREALIKCIKSWLFI